jgi:hypothetical protein
VAGILDDVCIAVQKLEKNRGHQAFDEMHLGDGLLPTPTKAALT